MSCTVVIPTRKLTSFGRQDKELAMDDEESECRNETAEEKYARRLARKVTLSLKQSKN